MKKIFWLLLLANLVTWVYFKRDVWAPAPVTAMPEIHPEQLTVLKEADLASLPMRSGPVTAENISAEANVAPVNSTASATPAEKMACYDWGSFASNQVNHAVDEANKLGITHTVQALQAGSDNKRYWIYKPPLASPEAAQAKAEELRRLGVDDFFIVQDAKWHNAISFGVFKDESLADALMEKLKQKGVRLVVKATRFGGEGHAMLRLQQVTATQLDGLKKAQPEFPDAEIKEITCP